MRFSDFKEINNLLEAEYLVGYFGVNNVRISIENLLSTYIEGSGNEGFVPIFSSESVIEDSIIFYTGDNVVVGSTNDSGYKFSVYSGPLSDGLLIVSENSGIKISATGPGQDILTLEGEEGEVVSVPVDSGTSILVQRRIVHPDAELENQSSTLGQVVDIVEEESEKLTEEINLRVKYEDVGSPDGVASLDSNGKILISEIPDSILGQVSYQGVWDITTNTPSLIDPPAAETKGDYYIVSGIGTFAGIGFEDGDWIISKGDQWQKVDNTDAVRSVFGRIGDIVALEVDYQNFYPRLSQSYSNPSFIASLSWLKIIDAPDFITENDEITLSGDVTGSGKTSISTTISNGVVTNTKIRESNPLSVIGRSFATTGFVADISASQNGHVLRRSGDVLSFGLLSDDSILDLSWSKIQNTPTTILGYGITDAYTSAQVDNILTSFVPYTGATTNVSLGPNSISALSFIKNGGTSSQFLKADGSVDSTSYVPNTRSITAGTGLIGGGNLSADRTISFDTVFGDNRYLAPLTGYVPYTGATQNVNLGEFGLSSGYIKLDTTPTNTPVDQGTIFWDQDNKTVDVILNGYIMKIGEDQFYPVNNQTGASIPKGTAVGFAGTLGMSGRLLAAPFLADGSMSSTFFMGVTAETIANGGEGKVLNFGRIRGINTNAFNEGDILYVSTTVPGGFQTTVPQAPNNIIQVAAVIAKSTTVGTIFVRPTLGSSINKDEGVKITSGQAGDILQLQANGLFENKTKAQYLGGTSSQFVKGDGSLDSSEYLTEEQDPVFNEWLSGNPLNITLQDVTDNGNTTTNTIVHAEAMLPQESATFGQVKEITGERTNLNTQDKNNLVQAINESNTWTVIEW